MTIALIAAACMIAQDIAGTIMVMAEAANRGWLAGLFDTVGWYVAITTTTISVESLSGNNTAQKVWVLLLVGMSNLVGTKAGQVLGQKLLKRFPVKPANPVVMPQAADIERRLAALEGRS